MRGHRREHRTQLKGKDERERDGRKRTREGAQDE